MVFELMEPFKCACSSYAEQIQGCDRCIKVYFKTCHFRELPTELQRCRHFITPRVKVWLTPEVGQHRTMELKIQRDENNYAVVNLHGDCSR